MIGPFADRRSPHGAVFVPGYFVPTNKLLSDMRAAGYHAGAGGRASWRVPADRDAFAAEARRVRKLVTEAVYGWITSHCEGRPFAMRPRLPVVLGFALVGVCHSRYDADAWYLAGKAAADGCGDGGLYLSDREGVSGTMGTVCRSMAESERLYSWALNRRWLRVPGLLVMWWGAPEVEP